MVKSGSWNRKVRGVDRPRSKLDDNTNLAIGEYHGRFDPENVSGIPRVFRRVRQTPTFDRPRKTGIVGPEPDLSVRFSYIPLGLIKTVREWYPRVYHHLFGESLTHVRRAQRDLVYYAETRPPKGYARIHDWWDSRQVKVWTSLCNAHSIRYACIDGADTYIVPRVMLGKPYRVGDNFYAYKKPQSLSHIVVAVPPPRGKRSESSELRRLLCKQKIKLAVKPIGQLFVFRRAYSRKELSSLWFQRGKPCSFREFRNGFPQFRQLNTERPSIPISPIVQSAIDRIYSRQVRIDEPFNRPYKMDAVKPPVQREVTELKETQLKEKRRLISFYAPGTKKDGSGQVYAMYTTGRGGTAPGSSSRAHTWNRLREYDDLITEDTAPGSVLGDWGTF